jgi:hypothetical protein
VLFIQQGRIGRFSFQVRRTGFLCLKSDPFVALIGRTTLLLRLLCNARKIIKGAADSARVSAGAAEARVDDRRSDHAQLPQPSRLLQRL